jgi:predicted nucleic acid-binding protein
MHLIYLDTNCFQRSFDDLNQPRIYLEALACEHIFNDAKKGIISLAWSFMHHDEMSQCQITERTKEMENLSKLCKKTIAPNENIHLIAKGLNASGFSPKDSLHLASALSAQCSFFITCDDGIIKRATKNHLSITILNPVKYKQKRGN